MTPLVPFARAAAEPALVTWAAMLTGVEASCVVWGNGPRPRHNGQLVLLSEVSLVGVGSDGETWEFEANADPLQEMTPSAEGARVWTVQVAVETLNQGAGVSARHLASQASVRSAWGRAHAILRPVGLALVNVGDARAADYRGDGGRMVARSIFEARFNTVVRQTDTAGRTAYIDTVTATATIRDPAGVAAPDTLQPGGAFTP